MRLFSNISDDELVANLVSHQAEVAAFVQALLPGDPSAADVVQKTNLIAWKKRGSFKRGTNFRAWILSIARYEVRGYRKQRMRKSWLVIDGELADRIQQTMVQSAEILSMDDFRIALEQCIGQLPPAERSLIEHRYYSDRPLKEFAEAQGRTIAAVKVSLFRIRAALKRCIESRIPGTPSPEH